MSQKKSRKTPTSDPVTAYAKAVVSGESPAGPHVRDACARHLRDLKDGKKRGIKFDKDAALRAINFCRDVLKLNGGDFEGVAFHLLPWQCFIFGSLFGWKGSDGYRRFRVAYVETGKGSGKSPLAAAVGLYGLMADGEARAEVYAAAAKRDQAMILFRDAVAMVDQSPALKERLTKSGTGQNTWNLAYLKTGSFFRPISSGDGQSGPRPHIVLLDEIHEHKRNDMVEMMRAGTKGRRQALIYMITNSGTDKTSVCWEYHDYGAKVSAGQIDDDSFFSYIAALDEGDDPFQDESCWAKANPSLGITIPHKYLREQITQARGMPSKESKVRRLNFCQWVEAHSPWISGHLWLRAKSEPVDLRGRRCWAGLDLSSTTDLTSLQLLFEPSDLDPYWRLKSFFWLPSEGLHEKADKDKVPYLAWADRGYLKTTEGAAINKMAILQTLAEVSSAYDIQSIAYDRWRIEDLKMLINQEGYELPELVGFGQGFKDMAPAVDQFETLLISDAIRHEGNPVMTWCAANAVVETDPAGNRKLSKKLATGRIDGIVAAVMAAGRSILDPPKEKSFWETA